MQWLSPVTPSPADQTRVRARLECERRTKAQVQKSGAPRALCPFSSPSPSLAPFRANPSSSPPPSSFLPSASLALIEGLQRSCIGERVLTSGAARTQHPVVRVQNLRICCKGMQGVVSTALAAALVAVVLCSANDALADVLIASGRFSAAGGVSATNIAQWNGTAWAPIGAGIPTRDGWVASLAVFEGALHAGGNFSGYVTRWDGEMWTIVGRGTNNIVAALHVYQSKLIAGGWFGGAGGVAASYIAQWNGTVWAPLGAGTNGQIDILTSYGGLLIVGGTFEVPARNMAQWDGTVWSSVGGGVDYGVYALGLYRDALIVGGFMLTAGPANVTVNRTASWNGSDWSAMGLGMSDTASAFVEDSNGYLIAGGSFIYAGGQRVNHLAQWDGTAWTALAAGGTNNFVDTLAMFRGVLVMGGGNIRQAGNVSVNQIAQLSPDGSHWTSLDTGITGSNIPEVACLLVIDESVL